MRPPVRVSARRLGHGLRHAGAFEGEVRAVAARCARRLVRRRGGLGDAERTAERTLGGVAGEQHGLGAGEPRRAAARAGRSRRRR